MNARETWLARAGAAAIAAMLALLLLSVDPAMRQLAAEVFLEDSLSIGLRSDSAQQRTLTEKTLRFRGTEWLAQYQTSNKTPAALIDEMDQLYGKPLTASTESLLPEEDVIGRLAEAIVEYQKGVPIDVYGVGPKSITRIYGRVSRPQRDPVLIAQAFETNAGSVLVTMRLKDPGQFWEFARVQDPNALRERLSNIIAIPRASSVLDVLENENDDFRVTTYYIENAATPRDMASFYVEHYPDQVRLHENGETEVLRQRLMIEGVRVEIAHVGTKGARSTTAIKVWSPVRG